MRILKFRIWNDVLKVMYTPELDAEIINLWETPPFKGGVFVPRDGIKIMQFTGLKDSKGNEIYEGDILDFDEREWGGRFDPEVIYFDQIVGDWKYSGSLSDVSEWRTVIGNVWEHDYLIPQK